MVPPPPPPSPPLPRAIAIRRAAGQIDVDYTIAPPGPGQAEAAFLVVTINSPDDRLPPASFAFPIAAGAEAGTETPARAVPDDQSADIHISTVSARGVATAAVAIMLAAGQAQAAWSAAPG